MPRNKILRIFTTLLLASLPMVAVGLAADLSVVPFFDCDRGGLLNTWGGPVELGNLRGIRLQTKHVHSSQRALALDLGSLAAGETHYFQCLASGFGPAPGYSQTRDLTSYERIEFWAQNATHIPLQCILQLKDHRDSDKHRA